MLSLGKRLYIRGVIIDEILQPDSFTSPYSMYEQLKGLCYYCTVKRGALFCTG